MTKSPNIFLGLFNLENTKLSKYTVWKYELQNCLKTKMLKMQKYEFLNTTLSEYNFFEITTLKNSQIVKIPFERTLFLNTI